MPMEHLATKLPERYAEKVTEIADYRGMSESAMLREIVTDYLKRENFITEMNEELKNGDTTEATTATED